MDNKPITSTGPGVDALGFTKEILPVEKGWKNQTCSRSVVWGMSSLFILSHFDGWFPFSFLVFILFFLALFVDSTTETFIHK